MQKHKWEKNKQIKIPKADTSKKKNPTTKDLNYSELNNISNKELKRMINEIKEDTYK
jgi:hypothetical protein